MRRLYQFFQQPEAGRFKALAYGTGGFWSTPHLPICWYPSAGRDFRHIRYLEVERLNDAIDAAPPLVYVHSDMLVDCGANRDRMPETPFAFGDEPTKGIEVRECFEVKPKKTFFRPSPEVWHLGTDRFTGRVFVLVLTVRCSHRQREISLTVPVIYFGYENLNLLVDFFIANQLRVHTLVHIKDGGGTMGGSAIPMNFIYQAADYLRIRRVICDEGVGEKSFNVQRDHPALMNQFHQNDNYAVRQALRSGLWVDTSTRDWRSQWAEKVIFGYGCSVFESCGRIHEWSRTGMKKR